MKNIETFLLVINAVLLFVAILIFAQYYRNSVFLQINQSDGTIVAQQVNGKEEDWQVEGKDCSIVETYGIVPLNVDYSETNYIGLGDIRN